MTAKQETLLTLSKEMGIPFELLQGSIDAISKSVELPLEPEAVQEMKRNAFIDGIDFIDSCRVGRKILRNLMERYPDLNENSNITEIFTWFDSLVANMWQVESFDETIQKAEKFMSDLVNIKDQYSSLLEHIELLKLEGLIEDLKDFLDLDL